VADPNAYQQAIGVALNDAKSMLGKNEVPDRSEIQSYLRDGGQDLDPHKLAWCAAFVSASLQKAGLPVPTQVVKDSAFGPGAYAPNYLTYGSAVDPKNIQAGDILVNNNGSHVGFAEGPIRNGPNGPEVQLLAGNQRDTSGQYAPGSYTNPTTGAVANRAQVGQVGESWVPLSQYSARRYQPTDDASQPTASASSSAAPSTPGTTINSTAAASPGGPQQAASGGQASYLPRLMQNIAGIESAGWKNPYEALGPVTKRGDRAYGKYQVMGANIPSWTQEVLGQSMTPQQFAANPDAQEKVAQAKLGQYAAQYGPGGAANMWFTGRPNPNPNMTDATATTRGTSAGNYLARATAGIDTSNSAPTAVASATPGTTLNSPPVATGGPAPAPATGQPAPAAGGLAGALPGFQAGSPGAKMTAGGLQQLAGGKPGGGATDEPPPMPLQQAPQAQAMGGAMMMRPGGQNMEPRMAAMQALAQQGFMTQPSVAAFGGGALQSPVPAAMPGGATGMPTTGIAGTTLNSPSQLQMALMTGALSPYDMYARQAGS